MHRDNYNPKRPHRKPKRNLLDKLTGIFLKKDIIIAKKSPCEKYQTTNCLAFQSLLAIEQKLNQDFFASFVYGDYSDYSGKTEHQTELVNPHDSIMDSFDMGDSLALIALEQNEIPPRLNSGTKIERDMIQPYERDLKTEVLNNLGMHIVQHNRYI